MNSKFHVILLILLLNFMAIDTLFAEETKQHLPEIHLLIDNSASMRFTDPRNLRLIGVKMFAYLIKNQACMSIASFDEKYTPLITLTETTLSYLSKVNNIINSRKILSNGQWTNINKALDEANQGWIGEERKIILLTDGKLDIGTKEQNLAAYEDLIKKTIPQLQKQKVNVYTIGFFSQCR